MHHTQPTASLLAGWTAYSEAVESMAAGRAGTALGWVDCFRSLVGWQAGWWLILGQLYGKSRILTRMVAPQPEFVQQTHWLWWNVGLPFSFWTKDGWSHSCLIGHQFQFTTLTTFDVFNLASSISPPPFVLGCKRDFFLKWKTSPQSIA